MKKMMIAALMTLGCISLSAESLCLPKSHIMMTEEGIFINLDGHIQMAPTVHFLGNGMYEVTVEGYCGRCGWPMEKNKCTNQNCNGYGPRDRD